MTNCTDEEQRRARERIIRRVERPGWPIRMPHEQERQPEEQAA